MYALQQREPDRRRITTILIFKALNKLPKGKPHADDGEKKGYRPLPRRPGEERKWSGQMGKGYVPEVEIVKRVRRERRLSWGEEGEEAVVEVEEEEEMVTVYGFERIARKETGLTGTEGEMGTEKNNTVEAQRVGQKRGFESQHQAQFFSLLPKDVRLLIYEKVLGGRLLHIVRRSTKLGHVPCKRGDSKESCRALGCRGFKEFNGYYASNGEEYANLIPMLQVCRRMYVHHFHACVFLSPTPEFLAYRSSWTEKEPWESRD